MPVVRPLRQAAFALAATLAVAGCQKGPGAERPPEPGDQAAARVDGQVVWVSDVRREAVAQGRLGRDEALTLSSDLFRQILSEVVDQRLLAAEAARRRLDRDPEAQRRLAAARDRTLGDLLIDREIADAVTDKNVRGLYAEQQKNARRVEQFRARQIVVPNLPEAQALKAKLAAGADFAALALASSTDGGSRFAGGEMGVFALDAMPPAYATALGAAKPGDLVGPFLTDHGYALVRVEDRRVAPPVSLEAARPQIVRFLTYDRVRDLLETLRAKAKVETLIGPAAKTAPIPAPAGAPANGGKT